MHRPRIHKTQYGIQPIIGGGGRSAFSLCHDRVIETVRDLNESSDPTIAAGRADLARAVWRALSLYPLIR